MDTLTFMVTKDTGLRIRVDRQLRQDFIEACRAQDKPAAQVLREFMRDYVRKHRHEVQQELFDSTTSHLRTP